MLRLLYQPYKWLIFIPVFIGLNTLVMGSLAIMLSFFNGTIAGRWAARPWARIAMLGTPATVKVTGNGNLKSGQSYVVVANHVSQYDIFTLYGWLDLDLKWVMKKELRKVPVIGAACAAMGHIFLDRSDKEGSMKMLRDARQNLTNGKSVLFFPEGTRSRKGVMLPFKAGAFVMARDLGLPILPISIIGTSRILPSDTLDLYPGAAEIVIHPAISAERVRQESVKTIMQETREIIASGLDVAQPDMLVESSTG